MFLLIYLFIFEILHSFDTISLFGDKIYFLYKHILLFIVI